jgi:gas vesicle protein
VIGGAKDSVTHSVSSVVESAGAKATRLKRDAAQTAADAAHAARHHASNVRHEIGKLPGEAAKTSADALHTSRESAHNAKRKAAEATTALLAAPAALLGKAYDHKEATAEAAKFEAKATKQKQRALREAQNHLDSYRPAYNEAHHADVRVEENSSKWLWIAVGLLAGAALALLLAPASGRRSRAALQDKAVKAKRGTAKLGRTAKSRVINLSNQVGGKIQERRHACDEDFADDITVADRVRTTLGENPVTRNLDRINVDSVDGVVTLRGPIVERELQAQIEEIVRGVKGVVEVRSDMLVADAPEDEATFVG